MAHILVSAGPIPARLDSVKFITNRFKGGLAFKTAWDLFKGGHDITVVKWKHTPCDYATSMPSSKQQFTIIDVDDIQDYQEKVLSIEADVYVMAAAVANLMPSLPWKGKFPSHNYKVGQEFDIKFEIAPRIIDMVKDKYPRAGLVGYKLFDDCDEELVKAGIETLHGSRANIVFANHPNSAKRRKIMLTQDGCEIPMDFEEHVQYIHKLALAKYYGTEITDAPGSTVDSVVLSQVIKKSPKHRVHGRTFGTFAIRTKEGMITTPRQKTGYDVALVFDIDYEKRIVHADKKATLNAPLLHRILEMNPEINVLMHGHAEIPGLPIYKYEFPGTHGEVLLGNDVFPFNIKHHGYILGYKSIKDIP